MSTETESSDSSDNKNYPSVSPLRDQMASAMEEMTKTDIDIYNFKLFLMNAVEKDNELVSKGLPLVNDDGVRKLIGMLESVANTHYILSDHSHDDSFNNIIDFWNHGLSETLLENKKTYGIKDNKISNAIFSTFMGYTYGIVKRGMGERPFWTKIEMEYNIRNNQQPKKEGMLKGLFKK